MYIDDKSTELPVDRYIQDWVDGMNEAYRKKKEQDMVYEFIDKVVHKKDKFKITDRY